MPRLKRTPKDIDQPFEMSFNAFAAQREDLMRTLRGLSLEQWERTCQINHSVFSQTRRMALHEAEHFAQFQSVVDKLKAEKQSQGGQEFTCPTTSSHGANPLFQLHPPVGSVWYSPFRWNC